MRNIRVKTTCHGMHVNITLAPSNAPLGNFRDAALQVREIRDIPDDVDNSTVVRIFSRTCDCTWLGDRPPRLVFSWNELGDGRIIRS